MVNIRKFINISLITSNDVFKDIMLPLNKRNGFKNGTVPFIPIYFYRFIGIKDNCHEYYNNLCELDSKLRKLGNSYLKFTSYIPFETNTEFINKFQSIWTESNLSSFTDDKIELLIKLFRDSAFIPDIKNSLLNSSIDEALSYTLNLYMKNEPNINLTKVKNFALKLVFWIREFTPGLLSNFTIKHEYKKDIINPKVVYFGDIKKHEVYFLIFLSRLGCDILYINSPNDGEFSIVDNQGRFSKVIHLPNKSNLDLSNCIFEKRCNLQQTTEMSNTNNNNCPPANVTKNFTSSTTFNIDEYKNFINPIYKTSNDILKDFLTPLNKRSGFIGSPMPLIPIYFYRYIGIKENTDNYYNSLYSLNKKLEKLDNLYLLFTKDLPIENNKELMNKTSKIWGTVPLTKDPLMSILIDCNVFPNLQEPIINSSIIRSFSVILEIYLDTEPHINKSKIKNFTIKLLMWIYRYVPDLFKNFDYLKTSSKEVYNPKIVYYGNIKKHEALFLIFLSLMGCDILYVNSNDDATFEEIDKEEKYSKVFSLPYKEELKNFPMEEIIVRPETTAFKASKEISSVIYNEKDGLFKAWQLENYNTCPLTLKTTYDELKLLWHEESRVRPGFKVENNTAYIPNLFAKVSGVHGDLNTYWNDFNEFKEENNVLFILKIPYTKANYSKFDLYSLDYCFKDGLVDKESLFKHRLYKFSYLKTSIQNGIIDKINQLMGLSPFKNPINTEFKLKMLMTILNLDKDILELIQKFDYPFEVPKIIIYDKDESIFNDADSIILAFLNLMCFDIVIFTPTGYNNIEEKILENYYDTHKLENIEFNLNIPNLDSIKKNKSNSFWSNLFK